MNDTGHLAAFLVPERNEAAPENLDGSWFPSAVVTRKQINTVFSGVK